jgi:hypothetical protein
MFSKPFSTIPCLDMSCYEKIKKIYLFVTFPVRLAALGMPTAKSDPPFPVKSPMAKE